ncbi:sensor histidine kinase [Streptacidiphilus jiangxiensis]|nr:sensor histidine kinase [Streptacidiphilus jiangxiensis]
MRLTGRRTTAVDAVLAVLVFVVTASGATDRLVSWLPAWSVFPMAAVQAGCVLFRRRAPLAVLAVTSALGAFMIATGVPGLSATGAAICAVYAVAVYGPGDPADPATPDGAGRSARSGALACLVATFAVALAGLAPTARSHAGGAVPWPSLTLGLGLALAWVSGYAVRTRRAYVAQLEERARRLEREEGERAARAVAEERLRIARELHDVVGHSISLITVQAEAAGRTARTRPEDVPAYLATISAVSREALAEMRRVLAVLRPQQHEDLEPQPGLDTLPELVAKVEAAGLPVRLDVEPQSLPPGVGLAVYRIVQEALTNTLKHAGPAAASVTVARSGGMVRVCVADDGRGPQGAPGPDAHGLLGLRERVAVYDGTLHAGPRQGGGFELRATLRVTEEGT